MVDFFDFIWPGSNLGYHIKPLDTSGMKISKYKKPIIINFAVTLVVCIGILLAFEVALRFKKNDAKQPRMEILNSTTFEQKEQFIKDRNRMSETVTEPEYYDYHLYSAGIYHSNTINFDYYYGYPVVSRYVPDSSELSTVNDRPLIIWFFGGSTMQNLETTDDYTIANACTRTLKENNTGATVLNFGTGGFQSSMELVKYTDLLRRVGESKHPDVVVFYDGFNDTIMSLYHGPGNFGEDYHSRVKAVITKNYFDLFSYVASEKLSRISLLWRNNIHQKIASKFYRQDKQDSAAEAVFIYLSNVAMITGISREFNITPIFVLQPLVITKENPTAFEKEVLEKVAAQERDFGLEFYSQVKTALYDNPHFLDLSDVLDDSMDDDFFDYGHIGPKTGIKIGAKIADFIDDLPKDDDSLN